MIPIAVCGALVGFGVFLIVRVFRPAPPRLDAVLAHMDGQSVRPEIPDDVDGLFAFAGPWLTARLAVPGGLPIPRKDLSLIGQSVERFLTTKVACLLLGLWIPASTNLVAGVVFGSTYSWLTTGAASLAMGAALFFAPDLTTRQEAAKRRIEFRRALTSYLDWVTLERAAGAHSNQSLESAAAISNTWPFRRIRQCLDRARTAQVQPWQALADLGEEVGIEDLTDLGEMAALAGDEGARIVESLTAKAESLRNAELSAARAEAGSSTATMVIPIALLALGFLAMLTFPVVYRLAGT